MSALMAWMPLGAQVSRQTARLVLPSSMGRRSALPWESETNTLGSVTRYSFFRAPSICSHARRTPSASAAATRATVSRGMALSFRPPWAEISRTAVSLRMAESTRPMSRLELPRPLSISTPE